MSASSSPIPGTSSQPGLVVLVVEDDPQLRRSVQWTLEDEGL